MKRGQSYSVPGFLASASSCGLGKEGELDLSLIVSQKRAVAAGVFTTNRIKAAPVVISQERIKKGFIRAILANTGCANACTGIQGLNDAVRTADHVAEHLHIDPNETVVASTGVIGAYLPVALIEGAIPGLIDTLSPYGFESVAQSLMTTDSFPKISYREGTVLGKPYHLMGVAKGAGMIMPHMATMLSFLLTDIDIDSRSLSQIFSPAVDATFNRVTVDGETSTNDMALILANGLAGNGELDKMGLEAFERDLHDVMADLAYMMAKDGEGASKVVTIEVHGAATKGDAERAARTVANSVLVKTAIFGRDANWGRIMAALGRAGIEIEEHKVQILISGIKIVDSGTMVGAEAEKAASEKMRGQEVTITIHLNQGRWKDRMITCDLTYDYIRINADYRS
ncbi:MAG: bifunctional glutamate N-acetyltransferase/amino-acid acetyltransferase ArgJ [Deltaproteobacteria bacterium]|nr:bifunctional glutamate N-acetyltransferase/amino-acid acetyltransferase ArgJ [Deltaproteobacteria bacterium]